MARSTDVSICRPTIFSSIDEVCAFFGGTRPLNPSTIWRGAGTRYPKPVKVGPNTSRWLRSECVAALQKLIEERATRRGWSQSPTRRAADLAAVRAGQPPHWRRQRKPGGLRLGRRAGSTTKTRGLSTAFITPAKA